MRSEKSKQEERALTRSPFESRLNVELNAEDKPVLDNVSHSAS
jgi:hypothetical protein